MKLMIIGDSIFRGVTYSGELRKHRLCTGYKLNQVRAMGIDVDNRSRMGATVARGLEEMKAEAAACDANTVILFELGGNDCDHDWASISAHPDDRHLPHTPEDDFVKTYGEAIRKAKASGATVILSTLVPIDPERYFTWISNGRSPDNIVAWLGDKSMLYRFQEHYNRIVERLAREYDCPLLDLREAFLLSHHYRDLLSPDGIHPTEAGHQLIESTLCNFLCENTALPA